MIATLDNRWGVHIPGLPNNRFKLPFFVLCAAVFVAAIALGRSGLFSAVLLTGCVVSIVVIVSGRHPRWMQSSLDRRDAKRRGRSD